MGVISAAMFFVLSNTKPLGRLSAQRPHPSIFCAYVFLSLLGQFLVHLAFLAGMYHVAKSGMSAVRPLPECSPACLAAMHWRQMA
jgi:manganese-transporting P-type ATPase